MSASAPAAPPAPAPPDVEPEGGADARRRLPSLKGLRLRAKRLVVRPLRSALVRHARGGPVAEVPGGAPAPVYILLVSPWGMGGTIRAALNLANYLADVEGRYVEVIGAYRRREEPFFDDLSPRVHLTALDDQRPGRAPKGPAGVAHRLLARRSSVLVHPSDRLVGEFSLWADLRLVRHLRGKAGILVSTRPGLNLIAAELDPPGMVKVGLEQMHYRHHVRYLRDAMKRKYRRLDAFVVLTEHDMRSYGAFLKGKVHLTRIPNTVRELPGPKADLSAKRVLAAGRLRAQKGFDWLIPAWAPVAAKHPDWKLRICGEGRQRAVLEALIREHGLEDSVELPGPGDMAIEMAEASIFVMSSRFEGFPLILLEAMSKGMAVVSFDCPTGPGDIVEDHRNGLLIPFKDLGALSAGLDEMVSDEALRRRCAGPAMETAHAYTMHAIGPRWVQLFDELWAARVAGARA